MSEGAGPGPAAGGGPDQQRRCPTCGGLVGQGAEFCGQCFTRLGGPAAPGPEADAGAEAVAAELRALSGGEEAADEIVPEPVPGAPPAASATGAAAGPPAPSAPASRTAPAPSVAGTPTRRPGAGPTGLPGVRTTDGGLVWDCPRCDLENPIEAQACSRCGTKFRQLFADEGRRRGVDPARAIRLSLLFPGAGHWASGQGPEGVARGILFVWTLGTVLTILLARQGSGLGPFLPLFALYVLAVLLIYGLTAVDAGRAADGLPPLVSSRVLLYGTVGLVTVTVVVLLVLGVRAGPAGGS